MVMISNGMRATGKPAYRNRSLPSLCAELACGTCNECCQSGFSLTVRELYSKPCMPTRRTSSKGKFGNIALVKASIDAGVELVDGTLGEAIASAATGHTGATEATGIPDVAILEVSKRALAGSTAACK